MDQVRLPSIQSLVNDVQPADRVLGTPHRKSSATSDSSESNSAISESTGRSSSNSSVESDTRDGFKAVWGDTPPIVNDMRAERDAGAGAYQNLRPVEPAFPGRYYEHESSPRRQIERLQYSEMRDAERQQQQQRQREKERIEEERLNAILKEEMREQERREQERLREERRRDFAVNEFFTNGTQYFTTPYVPYWPYQTTSGPQAANVALYDQGRPASSEAPQRRGNLPRDVTNLLRTWLDAHLGHPYPTEDEKQRLAEQTGLSIVQVSNWFINARRRSIPSIKRKKK